MVISSMVLGHKTLLNVYYLESRDHSKYNLNILTLVGHILSQSSKVYLLLQVDQFDDFAHNIKNEKVQMTMQDRNIMCICT
jgi:hypothetical protein